MDAKVEKFFTISDLYKAYRKAKADAFFDKTHFNSIAFANYEQKLDRNLDKLLSKLDSDDASWCRDVPAIGRYSHLPKSVDAPDLNDSRVIHYATLDPITDWEDQCTRAGVEVEANFRLIIVPTVEYLVISALWIINYWVRALPWNPLSDALRGDHRQTRVVGCGTLAFFGRAHAAPTAPGPSRRSPARRAAW